MLRRLVGDDAFFPGLRAYGDAHAWGTATRGELRATFRAAHGPRPQAVLGPVARDAVPADVPGDVPHRTPDASTVTLTVTQTQQHVVVHPAAGPNDKPFYVFPLVVRITHVDGTFDRRDGRPRRPTPTTTVTSPNPSKKFVAGITLDPALGRPQDRPVDRPGPSEPQPAAATAAFTAAITSSTSRPSSRARAGS